MATAMTAIAYLASLNPKVDKLNSLKGVLYVLNLPALIVWMGGGENDKAGNLFRFCVFLQWFVIGGGIGYALAVTRRLGVLTICSFQSVGGILFGAERSALASLGVSLCEGRNQRGEDEVTFETAIYRFAAGKLVEVSFQLPAELDLNGHPIAGGLLLVVLKQYDPGFRERHGFAIAPTLGLAVDLAHDSHWITAFVAGRWDHIR